MADDVLILGSDRASFGGVQAYSRDVEDVLSGRSPTVLYLAELPGRGALRRALFIAKALWLIVRKRPAAIYCVHIVGLIPAVLARRLGLTKRVVCALHGADVFSGQLRRIPTWMRSGVDVFLPVSRFVSDRVHEQGLDLPMTVLPNAISRELAARAGSGVAGERAGLLCVSRLEVADRYKNVDGLLKALPAIVEKIPDARLTVIGDGNDRARLEAEAKRLDLDGIVRFERPVPPGLLAGFYEAAALLVLPNLDLPNNAEGFGRVFIEAAAFGVPSVAGHSGGTTEAVVHGETGLLVDSSDVDAIASAVVSLLADGETYDRMSKNAIHHAANFNIDRFSQRVMAVLDGVIS